MQQMNVLVRPWSSQSQVRFFVVVPFARLSPLTQGVISVNFDNNDIIGELAVPPCQLGRRSVGGQG
jgi:hypothetical protein